MQSTEPVPPPSKKDVLVWLNLLGAPAIHDLAWTLENFAVLPFHEVGRILLTECQHGLDVPLRENQLTNSRRSLPLFRTPPHEAPGGR